MFIQMLKNQHVTFVNSRDEAERFSPFFLWWNTNSNAFVVSKFAHGDTSPVASGMDKEEADACVMFKANEYIFRQLQANNQQGK